MLRQVGLDVAPQEGPAMCERQHVKGSVPCGPITSKGPACEGAACYTIQSSQHKMAQQAWETTKDSWYRPGVDAGVHTTA